MHPEDLAGSLREKSLPRYTPVHRNTVGDPVGMHVTPGRVSSGGCSLRGMFLRSLAYERDAARVPRKDGQFSSVHPLPV